MSNPTDIPQLVVVRVSTGGGPFQAGDVLSLALGSSSLCRVARHGKPLAAPWRGSERGPLVPETIDATVESGCEAYNEGDVLALCFIDPAIARIHAGAPHNAASATPSSSPPLAEPPAPPDTAEIALPIEPARRVTAPRATFGVQMRLAWGADRVRRFVQVCDKLFTVDRLGWYRHALVTRLLVPDELWCNEAAVDREIETHLRALRASALETLGRPLLAAFMPNFNVTSEWLDSLDDPAAARSLAAIRDAIASRAVDDAGVQAPTDPAWTYGAISRAELDATPRTSVDALLPLMIAGVSTFEPVTEKLGAYRHALIELFGQTAGSAGAVRLSQMAQPSHILDDRLWQVVGAVGECFAGLAVAS